MIKILKYALVALAIFGICRFTHNETAGFRLSKIQQNTFAGHEAREGTPVREILSQPFTYLARGKQSFVFLSADGKIVLKLLSNHYQRRIQLLEFLPTFSWQQKQLNYFRHKLNLTEASYQLADAELRAETGVIFLHLHKTDQFKQAVTIIDKLGIKHEIDLDSTAFILQKSAMLAYPQLEAWIQARDLDAAKKGLASYVQLLKTRFEKGIADRDPLIRTNIGFREGQALFLDLGPFSKNISKDPHTEVDKITASLRAWLRERDPSLALFLEEESIKIYNPGYAL